MRSLLVVVAVMLAGCAARPEPSCEYGSEGPCGHGYKAACEGFALDVRQGGCGVFHPAGDPRVCDDGHLTCEDGSPASCIPWPDDIAGICDDAVVLCFEVDDRRPDWSCRVAIDDDGQLRGPALPL